jgi:hypothetical protein
MKTVEELEQDYLIAAGIFNETWDVYEEAASTKKRAKATAHEATVAKITSYKLWQDKLKGEKI